MTVRYRRRLDELSWEAIRGADAHHAAGHDWGALPGWLAAAYERGEVVFATHPVRVILVRDKQIIEQALADEWICSTGDEIKVLSADSFAKYFETADTVPLTFEQLRGVNVARCRRWHPTWGEPDDGWSGADWSNAMCGEAGETANVVKKIRRHELGVAQGELDVRLDVLLARLADELADTITYADLLAAHYGIDLAAAVASKFNRVSIRQTFPERLPEITT